MKRLWLLSLMLFSFLAGCGTGTESQPPFEGHWRMYEDEHGGFVTFNHDQITLGDKNESRSGTYTFEVADDQEPLYDIHADLDGEAVDFQLYYEEDTISLIGIDKDLEGLYEIIIEITPIGG